MTRLGSPSFCPTATALTASVGATTAPRTSAAPNVSSGTSQFAKNATANAVASTVAIPSLRIGVR